MDEEHKKIMAAIALLLSIVTAVAKYLGEQGLHDLAHIIYEIARDPQGFSRPSNLGMGMAGISTSAQIFSQAPNPSAPAPPPAGAQSYHIPRATVLRYQRPCLPCQITCSRAWTIRGPIRRIIVVMHVAVSGRKNEVEKPTATVASHFGLIGPQEMLISILI